MEVTSPEGGEVSCDCPGEMKEGSRVTREHMKGKRKANRKIEGGGYY